MQKPEDQREIRRAFAVTIRELRARHEMAQEGLAYAAQVDRGYMGRLERGESTPTLEMIFKLLPCLDVDFIQFAALFEINLRKMLKARRGTLRR